MDAMAMKIMGTVILVVLTAWSLAYWIGILPL